MQFVNTSNHTVYTSFTGTISPGRTAGGGSAKCHKLQEALEEIVKACGNKLGIRLTPKEISLIDKVVSLDERGCGFNPGDIPAEIRNDPTGAKRALERVRREQQAELEAVVKANEAKARREAIINGEIEERKPVGPATMEGQKVEPDMLKSGFEQIMEENAKIASKDRKIDPAEMLDPIGAHMKTEKGKVDIEMETTPAEREEITDPDSLEAINPIPPDPLEEDATKSADTEVPEAQAPGRGNKMDQQAAEMAEKLSTLGPDRKSKAKKSKAKKDKSK